ncbi:MAG: U32 family peptidase [Clostridiales bacterium]|nr:U32 family peptidase [Clostridiales bacterium]
MTELLAPAGNMEALRAAIANDADAVYLGGQQFSARAFAINFKEDELEEALRLLHFHGKKLYLAVNTLLSDRELQAALEFISKFYSLGLDAVIVQDLGLLKLIREFMPDLACHASTQMTVTNVSAARFVEGLGVERIILARELSFKEIETIRDGAQVKLEAFVHGALCFCYSGQCLMSSMIGGRSGNRGSCAQPCRLAYTLTDIYGDPLPAKTQGDYVLSPKDLVGYWRIEELHELGLAAWKIEGRMKKAEYVGIACRIYSSYLRLLDERRVIYQEDEDQRQLLQMFNRDYCHGYWNGNPGAFLISYQRPNNRGVFLGRVLQRVEAGLVVKLEQPLAIGDGLEVWVSSGGRYGLSVEKFYKGGEEAKNACPGDIITLPATAGKTGDRVFKTFDENLNQLARSSYAKLPEKELRFTIVAKLGQALTLSASDQDGFSVKLESEYIVEKAHTTTCDWQTLHSQLARLGGTGYRLGSIDGELMEGVMLPVSILNACRRELIAALMEQRQNAVARPLKKIPQVWPIKYRERRKEHRQEKPLQLSVLTDNIGLLPLLYNAGIKDIYFGTEGFTPANSPDEVDWRSLIKTATKEGVRLIANLPQIIRAGEEDTWIKRLSSWQELRMPGLRINHSGQFTLAATAAWKGHIYGGAGLNVFNSHSYMLFSELGLRRLTLSPELTLSQMADLIKRGAEKEIMAQGALPLMVSEHCVLGAMTGGFNGRSPCAAPCHNQGVYALRDEKGFIFPCKSDAACRTHIFNSRQLCLLEEIPNLRAANIRRLTLDLRLYEPHHALRIAELYMLAVRDDWGYQEALGKLPQVVREYTKGHLYRGV